MGFGGRCPLGLRPRPRGIFVQKKLGLFAVRDPDVFNLCRGGEHVFGRGCDRQAVVHPGAFEVARGAVFDGAADVCAGEGPDRVDVGVGSGMGGEIDVRAGEDVHHAAGHVGGFEDLDQLCCHQREGF